MACSCLFPHNIFFLFEFLYERATVGEKKMHVWIRLEIPTEINLTYKYKK
jgi:hypothetical protein